jgi:hypothetical protein
MPNRILYEKICTSETLAQLSAEEERFFYRLLVQCDDYGRFDGRPAVIRTRCFGLQIDSISEVDVSAWIVTLESVGLITTYGVDGRTFLQVTTWAGHQRMRAQRSKFPEPADIGGHPRADAGKCPRIRETRNEKRETNPGDETRAQAPKVPAAAAVGRTAGAATPPVEVVSIGQTAREIVPVPKPVGQAPGLAPLVKAFAVLNLPRPALPGPEVRAALELLQHYGPEDVAACWQAVACGDWGDDFSRRELSFAYLASRNRVGNWLRENGASPGVEDAAAAAGAVRLERF